jgi:hypothetical protein
MSEAEKLSKEEAMKELSETQPLRGVYADAFRGAEDEIESKDDPSSTGASTTISSSRRRRRPACYPSSTATQMGNTASA